MSSLRWLRRSTLGLVLILGAGCGRGELNPGEEGIGGAGSGGLATGGQQPSGGHSNGGQANGGRTNGGWTSGGFANGGQANGGQTNGGWTSGGSGGLSQGGGGGTPSGCLWGGTIHPVGSTFFDGCNTCSCLGENALACTTIACPACQLNGIAYPHGATGIPAGDGCNTCSCKSGALECTRNVCAVSCWNTGQGTCSPNEYCAYEGNGACGAGDATAVCRVRPMACDNAVFAEVCGCDGKSYQSACHAALAGVGYQDASACQPSACIVNGQVYPSGNTLPDPASCNTCTCTNGTIAGCTEIACSFGPPCVIGRAYYQNGSGYVSADGGLSCLCKEGTFVCSPIP